MALWDALIATRAVPARLGADTAKDDTALPGAKGGLPHAGAPNGKIDLPLSPRIAVAVGGYSVNLSPAAVAASHEPLPRLRALQAGAVNDPQAGPKPASPAASAARLYVERLELSTDDGLLSVANLTPRAAAAVSGDAVTVAPPLVPTSPEPVRFPRGAYPLAEDAVRPMVQTPAGSPASPMGFTERAEPRTYNDPALATSVAARAPASAELAPATTIATPAAPPEMLVRTDAPPAQMTPAVFAAAAQLAAAEEAKAAARLLPRPAGELIQQLLGSQDSPAPTPEFYRLIVGAAALGALLLLVL